MSRLFTPSDNTPSTTCSGSRPPYSGRLIQTKIVLYKTKVPALPTLLPNSLPQTVSSLVTRPHGVRWVAKENKERRVVGNWTSGSAGGW